MRLPAFLVVGLLVSALASAAPKKEESRKEPTKPEPKPSVVIKADPRTGETPRSGVKGGMHYGETDEIGSQVAADGVDVHDLHATVLRLLGFDHTKLTYRYNGRDFRLTDNFGKAVEKIIA